MKKYNIWNKWDPLKSVMLGSCYSADFFKDIKNDRIRSALTQIADETMADLEYYESVLKDFGCEVIRPELDRNDSIMNYINEDGAVKGNQGVPRSPLQPRDTQVVIGNELFFTHNDHSSIKKALTEYCSDIKTFELPINIKSFNGYRGGEAPDWPSYEEYIERFDSKQFSDNPDIQAEFEEIHKHYAGVDYEPHYPISAPSITVLGKDLYLDTVRMSEHDQHIAYQDYYTKKFDEHYAKTFRLNKLTVGGHNDGCFHVVKPGAICSIEEIQRYNDTFPGWDVCFLEDQSGYADAVRKFRKLRDTVGGKWWVPGQEDNDEFTHFVESWLNTWVGYVEETVFDVNMLVLDEKHVCVSQQNNEQVNKFLKAHGMEPVYVPWRHRYFWDGGLHCITLDLYREGAQQDYFPERSGSVHDKGFD